MAALKVVVAAVGSLKERYWREALAEYAKRLAPFVQLKLVEVPDVNPARAGGEAAARAQEAKALQAALKGALKGAHNGAQRGALGQERSQQIVLDRAGTPTSSEQLAALIETAPVQGASTLVFILGGPTGLDASLCRAADYRLSFGPLTLPHNLARVVLLEQLYRACKINAHEPYHR